MTQMMRKLFLTWAVALFAVTLSYAQKDIPSGGSMELASLESGDDQFALYKVKDKEGNPNFIFTASHQIFSFDVSTPDSSGGFGIGDGKALIIGESYEDALACINELIGLFDQADGTQKEFTCMDGSTVMVTLHKGFLGRHLSVGVGDASVSKGELKSLRTGLKLSKKLHSEL